MSTLEPPTPGSQPPRKSPPPESIIVEPAPRHDGAPCFAAYTVSAHHPTSRPEFGLRIYDTTPGAGDPARTRALARKIHLGTEAERVARWPSCTERDRVEVVGLPMAPDVSPERRAEICIAHNTAERAARRWVAPAFYIPWMCNPRGYRYLIVVLVRLGEGWEEVALNRPLQQESRLKAEVAGSSVLPEGEGTADEQVDADPCGELLTVQWELTEMARWNMVQAGETLPEVAVTRRMMGQLGHELAGAREFMANFVACVHDEVLEQLMRDGLEEDWRYFPS